MIEVFNRINQRMIKAIMFHEQMADYFDFLDMCGLKRWHEYQYLKENAELRGLHRYSINHLARIISNDDVGATNYIPASWYNATRMQVDNSTRRQAVKDAFEKWYDWEKETKEFLETQFKMLTDNSKIAEANKINSLIKEVDKELKKVMRKMLEYKAVDYDLSYIMFQQEDMHDHFKEKEKEIGIDIC